MEKKINVWLDGYWQAKLNKPKIQYTSISLDQMLVEGVTFLSYSYNSTVALLLQ
jgi:hypothetical protein